MSEISKIVRESGELSLLKARSEDELNGDLCRWAGVRLEDLCSEIEQLEFVLAKVRKACNQWERQAQIGSKDIGDVVIEKLKLEQRVKELEKEVEDLECDIEFRKEQI